MFKILKKRLFDIDIPEQVGNKEPELDIEEYDEEERETLRQLRQVSEEPTDIPSNLAEIESNIAKASQDAWAKSTLNAYRG